MTIQQIYASLSEALVADKSPATEYALEQLKGYFMRNNTELVAVLSTTVIPKDGLYSVKTFENLAEMPWSLQGVPHYCGHPATAAIVEELGAVKSESKLFLGLEVGQAAIAVSIKQGQSNRAKDGFTSPHQDVTTENLDFRRIVRLE